MNRDQIVHQLALMGHTLPALSPSVANFIPCVRSDNTLYVSGQIPMQDGNPFPIGRVGREVSMLEAQHAARTCALALLSHLCTHLAEGERVTCVCQLQGFVNADDTFGGHPAVINGASDLMVGVFGEAGKHSRFAIGVAGLPFGVPVEVAAIFEIVET
jgi:enamine deaminase RidA (YjgF/YER057c/UK114 family)